MFEKVKETIKESALSAVEQAERALGSGEGKRKKEMAVNFIVDKIKFPAFLVFLKPLAVKLLSAFIDEAIENAVELLKRRLEAGAA